MKTQMISLVPAKKKGNGKRRMNVYYLSKVAWNFAQAILWKEQKFSDEEIRATKTHLITYFRESSHRKKAMIAFCERVILTDKYITAQPGRYVPNPSVWFNRNYEHGFAGTKSWYLHIDGKRKDVPGYLKHLTVMANHYYMYALQPTPAILQSCHDKLLELNAKSLLQHFYNTIFHFNLLIQH
jgi:hypothetical protein